MYSTCKTCNCVLQKADEDKEGAGLLASEWMMFYEHHSLAHYLEAAVGGQWFEKREVWDEKCKDHCKKLNLPAEFWPRVHFPFCQSLDHAPVHKRAMKEMTRPRVDTLTEFRTVDDECSRRLGLPAFPERVSAACEKEIEHVQRVMGLACPDRPRDERDFEILRKRMAGHAPYRFKDKEDCYRCDR